MRMLRVALAIDGLGDELTAKANAHVSRPARCFMLCGLALPLPCPAISPHLSSLPMLDPLVATTRFRRKPCVDTPAREGQQHLRAAGRRRPGHEG